MDKNIPLEAVARNLVNLEKGTENIYETIVILTKRANQLASEEKEELHNKLSEFAPATDNLEEVFENREQIEISTAYEKRPKPSIRAIHEYMNDEVYFRRLEDKSEED